MVCNCGKQTNAKAQFFIGQMYRDGSGVEEDYKEGMKWYKLAAKQDYDLAQRGIGAMYRDGLGVEKNFEKALKWFLKALLLEEDEDFKNNIKKEINKIHIILKAVVNQYSEN